MRCPYCHNGSLARGQGDMSISPEELLAFLDSRVGRLEGICISGGEPTLHSDLPELIREIKARGFKVKLDTNGTNPEMLRALIEDELLDYVAMDIKNSPEKYALTAGVSVKCTSFTAAGGPPSPTRFAGEGIIQNVECRIVGASIVNLDAVSEEPLLAGEVAPQATERLLSNKKGDVSLPIMEKIKHSCDILLQNLVDFEFRTTLVRELHTEDDIRAIGKWLSGNEKFFLQTYRDEGDLLVGGFTAYTPEETRHLLEILREYIPSAEIRG